MPVAKNFHVEAMQLAKAGHWNESHTIVQTHSDKMSCLIHAYLHRVEGDFGNAEYWYRRANESIPDNNLDEEWRRLFAMLDQSVE